MIDYNLILEQQKIKTNEQIIYEKTQREELKEADKVMKNFKALMTEEILVSKTPSIQDKIRKSKSRKRKMDLKKQE